jgi:hypothetical protein
VKRHIASVASVLLCVVTAVLWVSSGFKPFAVERLGNHWMVQLHVAHGGILFGADAISPNANDYFGWVWYFKDGDEAGFFPAGSTFPYGEFSSYRGGWDAFIPIWLIAIPSALLPVILIFLKRIRRVRRKHGCHCLGCSYDLTGNTSGTCPECGNPIPTPAKTPETESPRPA